MLEFLYELLFHTFFSLTQLFVTAMWEIDDPELIRKRNTSFAVYGCGFTVLAGAILSAWLGWLHWVGLIVLFIGAFYLLLIAGA